MLDMRRVTSSQAGRCRLGVPYEQNRGREGYDEHKFILPLWPKDYLGAALGNAPAQRQLVSERVEQ